MEQISEDDARSAGLKHYFTGLPCKRGHVAARYVSDRSCVACKLALAKTPEVKDYRKQFRAENSPRLARKNKAWREENKDALRERRAAKYRADKAPSQARNKAYYRENKAAMLEYSRTYKPKWIEANRERVREQSRKRTRRYREDPLFCVQDCIRRRINESFKRGGFTKASSTLSILGCTWSEFAAHLERQFLPGMTWENRHLWQIDHIVPVASAKTEAEVLALNHVSNLRPLWAKDNLTKRAQIQFLL